MKYFFWLLFFSLAINSQCVIDVGDPTPPSCGGGYRPMKYLRQVTMFEGENCDRVSYGYGDVIDVLTINYLTNTSSSLNGILLYSGGVISTVNPCPVECFIACSRIGYKCGLSVVWSANVCAQGYAGPLIPPTTVVNAPTGDILPAPTNDDANCPGSFTAQSVTITGGGINVAVASFPADLCILLGGLPYAGGAVTISSSVTTACGKKKDTYTLPVVGGGGSVISVNGVGCFAPPTTVVNAPTGDILPAPTDTDGGCPAGFTSQVVTITGGGLNVTVPAFPSDLCDLIGGLIVPLGTKSLNITSTVTTACGTDIDTYSLVVEGTPGYIVWVGSIPCYPQPTTMVNAPVGTILSAPTNDDGGCPGGLNIEEVTINGGGVAPFPVTIFPADLCDILGGAAVSPGTNEMTIVSQVSTNCGIDTDVLVVPVTEVGGFITDVNGTVCIAPIRLIDTEVIVVVNDGTNNLYANFQGIDLTPYGGGIVPVASDLDVIAEFAALGITAVQSGLDFYLVNYAGIPVNVDVKTIGFKNELIAVNYTIAAGVLSGIYRIISTGNPAIITQTATVTVYDVTGTTVIIPTQSILADNTSRVVGKLPIGDYMTHIIIPSPSGMTLQYWQILRRVTGNVVQDSNHNASYSLVGDDLISTFIDANVLSTIITSDVFTYIDLYDDNVNEFTNLPMGSYTITNSLLTIPANILTWHYLDYEWDNNALPWNGINPRRINAVQAGWL